MTTLTVKATQGGAGATNGMLLRVFVLTGAKPVAGQTGNNVAHDFTTASSNFVQNLTTSANSNVYLSLSLGQVSLTFTPSNLTLLDTINDATDNETFVSGHATGTAAGTLSYGTAINNTTTGPFALLEILSATTLAEDASAPASVNGSVQTITTASFTPPPGSLLVAVVNTNGGATQVTMTVTDNLGTHLNWTEVVKANAAGDDYAGIWIADVPPAGSAYQGFEPPPFAFPPLSRQFGPLAPFTVPGNGDFPPPITNPYPVMQIAATTSAFTVTRSTGPGDGITLLANVGTQVTGVTDSQGNTWILAQSDTTDQVYLAYTTYNGSPGTPTKALVAGVDTITVTGASSGLFLVSGVKGVAPYAADKNPAFTRATGTAVTGPATGTLTNANEVVLAWSAAPSASIVSSWTAPFNRYQDGQNAQAATSLGALFPATTASVTPAATLAVSGAWAAMTLALFLNPFTPPATAFTQVSHPARAQPQLPVRNGRTASRAGVFGQLGPPVRQLRQPVRTPVPPLTRGRNASITGIFDQLGPPVRQLRQPVRAQPQVPFLSGRTERRTGIFGGLGPPVRHLPEPVKAQPQFPVLTGRSRHLAGIFGQLGPPVRQLRQPVRITPSLPPRGQTRSVAGTFTAAIASGPPVYPQRSPARAQPQFPVRTGRSGHLAGIFGQLGPPVRQLRQPVQARQPLPPRGRAQRTTGTFTFVVVGQGPPVYPLGHPVKAQPGPQRGGTAQRHAGIFQGLGPPVRPQTHPVRVPVPPLTRGRTASTTGTYTFVVIGAGPPVYPLRQPVRAPYPPLARGRVIRTAGTFTAVAGPGPVYPLRQPVRAPYPPVARGRVIRAAGTFQGTGPPVTPLRQPVGIWRRQPPPPNRGRTASQRGPLGQLGPPTYALRHPVRAAWPPGRRGGQVAVLHGTFTPPPLFVKATGTATVTDPRDGTAFAAADPREGRAGVSDPREGTVFPAADPREGAATVTDPREGRASPAS